MSKTTEICKIRQLAQGLSKPSEVVSFERWALNCFFMFRQTYVTVTILNLPISRSTNQSQQTCHQASSLSLTALGSYSWEPRIPFFSTLVKAWATTTSKYSQPVIIRCHSRISSHHHFSKCIVILMNQSADEVQISASWAGSGKLLSVSVFEPHSRMMTTNWSCGENRSASVGGNGGTTKLLGIINRSKFYARTSCKFRNFFPRVMTS